MEVDDVSAHVCQEHSVMRHCQEGGRPRLGVGGIVGGYS